MTNNSGASARRKSKRLKKNQEATTNSDGDDDASKTPSAKEQSPFVPDANADADDGHQSDSSAITPPPPFVPAKVTPKRPAKSDTVSGDDSDSDVVEVPQARKKGKKAKTADVVEDLSKRELILHVPRAFEPGNQRENLTHATTFETALGVIHRISISDWDGCLKDVRRAENAKKGDVVIPVRIEVTDQYLKSLRSKLGKSKGTALASGNGARGKKVPILDLDHAASGDDDFDDGVGDMEEEGKWLENLQNEYGHCQSCGPTKCCKITFGGTHHAMSNSQLRAWSKSLTLRQYGVTLKTPPRDVAGQGLFGMFFKTMPSSSGITALAIAPPQLPFAGMPPYMMHPYSFMQPPPAWASASSAVNSYPDMSAGPSHASTSRCLDVLPSSDPPDMGAVNIYPHIDTFLQQLDAYEPHRKLLDYITTFDDLDFYNINKIASLKTAEEIVRVTKTTLGNAKYILKQVKAEMKRINRARTSLE
ncbi:hypothetical protein K438DRAFT_2151365 [Mycena galopus ATCC 62051]|nr:hypothetical protein K438DRAFT_2151365 [Mycena galopus ATCC 62051]